MQGYSNFASKPNEHGILVAVFRQCCDGKMHCKNFMVTL